MRNRQNRAALFAGRAYDRCMARCANSSRDSRSRNRQAADAISEGYGQGRFSLLEVLDAQASVAQARLRGRSAAELHIAVATIEGLVGNPFALARGAHDEKTFRFGRRAVGCRLRFVCLRCFRCQDWLGEGADLGRGW